jgi:hypothetical protein
MLSELQKQELIKKLDEKFKLSGQALKCPMCTNQNFSIADGYFNNTLQENLSSIALGGTSIPTIGIVCTNCGFLSQHALGIINALPQTDGGEKK